MRIVHIYRDFLDAGGVPHLTRRLVEAQSARGHEILVLCRRPDEVRNTPTATAGRMKCLEVYSSPAGLRDVAEEVAVFQPDVIHVSGLTILSQQLWTVLVARRGTPYVISPHGVLNPLGMSVRFGAKPNARSMLLAKRVCRKVFDIPILKRAAAVHAECDFEATLARAVGARDTFNLPIGIDDEWINPVNASARRLGDPVTFLHLGRLDICQKGLDLILASVKQIADGGLGGRLRVILAGSTLSGSWEQIGETIRRYRLTDLVEMREPVWREDEKAALWREADYFLTVFRYGGMPRATAEALGNGLPLLASRESNWGDWTCKKKMGRMVALDVDSVARGMSDLMSVSPTAFTQMAANAYGFACSHSWSSVAEAFDTEYKRLLSHPL